MWASQQVLRVPPYSQFNTIHCEVRRWSAEKGMKVSVAQVCPALCDPMGCSPQAPLSVGFSRQEYWTGFPLPSPGDLLALGIKPWSLAVQADSLPPPGKGNNCLFNTTAPGGQGLQEPSDEKSHFNSNLQIEQCPKGLWWR